MRADLTGVLLPALLLLLAVAAPPAHAGNWSVIHAESRLGFTATQTGSEFSGRFEDFDADMTFHADDLAASVFDVTVDVTSVNTGSNDRDSTLAEEPWFWFEEFPRARFETKRIVHKQGDTYEAVADLTIKSNTHEVTLPFTWTRRGDNARIEGKATAIMEGGLSMDRTRWEVGTGEWSSGDTVGRQVDVEVDMLLKHEAEE